MVRAVRHGRDGFKGRKQGGGGETENGTGNDEENGGRMVIGQEDMEEEELEKLEGRMKQ